MTPGGRNTEEELIASIEEYFGFKKELIKNPEQCGLWHVSFEVNGIKYYGAISYHGALPTIAVKGYTTEHYYHDTPVEDWYYNEYIKDKEVMIARYLDRENGDWEDTGIRCKDQEEAKERIKKMSKPEEYWYEIVH